MIWAILIFVLFIAIIEFFSFIAIKHAFRMKAKPVLKRRFSRIYFFTIILIALLSLIYFVTLRFSNKPDYIIYRNYFFLTGIFSLFFLPKFILLSFALIEYIIRIPALILKKLKFENKILQYISSFRIFSFIGVIFTIIMMFVVLNGIIFGKTNFKVEHVSIEFPNLPQTFDGIKIAQISDMHLGSFSDSLDVRKGIDLMMSEKPDIIFFTGDLINNLSDEAKMMLPELKRIHAPFNVFSILGNHDVGDYRRWKTIKEKTEDFNNLVKIEQEAGFKLLINQNYVLKKNNDSIAIIGVNSWGTPPFKQYGKLEVAIKGVENAVFKILLTHIPSHWDAEVAGKNNADLTLSGHTHAMQFGIDCCGFYWCPLEYMYPHWAGLYNEGNQYLYVNRGFGFLGFPGRIGMTPEITIIELKRK
ncbi:MAG TPA: metallophosphoesterase [Bacteroidales bacterium]|nr:metallophosphoesterase [Bacteroidales bacterium]HPS17207.1 metallophosphoesterase [Bacteroidales bacterium]